MEILHLALLVVISIICFKIGQGVGQKEVEKQQSQYIQLQENEQLIEEIDEEYVKQVDQQEQDLKEAIKKFNQINQRDKQLQKQLNDLKNTQTNNAKPKVQQNELLSDKDFDNLLDEGFVVDQEINETQLDQDLIEASK
ncbi:unnamed protein product (macronuclear) [Paramecium tetraurelia]|uniref:Uncharacterized protein n=1 Tax=Paramecium tetraurelia TaxID=5888 RepID=A0D2K2_PARTE|nr:uncharacterized protein GSPATT00012777001 [Paramecium tetraurelia]CAK77269.1 unnamed protein product [Paramecium tetraurelia]|eukprot:XP_001444666.1 hypothetical protein (macronuclear) [Paramecium tetraurelia strain d4-2]